MSDFIKDLEAKAYALVAGSLELEDFRAWYRLAVVASAPESPQSMPEAIPFVPPPKTQRFEDYQRDIDEPDEAMREHHRKMLGSGTED